MANKKINQDFSIPWDYEVLAITQDAALLCLEKPQGKKEYVAYKHDNKGILYSGLYTSDRKAATDNYLARSAVYL